MPTCSVPAATRTTCQAIAPSTATAHLANGGAVPGWPPQRERSASPRTTARADAWAAADANTRLQASAWTGGDDGAHWTCSQVASDAGAARSAGTPSSRRPRTQWRVRKAGISGQRYRHASGTLRCIGWMPRITSMRAGAHQSPCITPQNLASEMQCARIAFGRRGIANDERSPEMTCSNALCSNTHPHRLDPPRCSPTAFDHRQLSGPGDPNPESPPQ